jgi:methyltransferase-like protein/SAM-dependent methyltransferase
MNAVTSTSYDEVPYESKPLFATLPDCLATAARLRGLAAPAPTHCRVLELGCAAGGNLIPMAYGLPESRFVGLDLSQRQIAEGQALCRRLELANVELRAASIADVDQSWGEFDYIICHGVYSWVPPPIQDHILWVCRHLLSPRGVAYVSYNTYPGWHLQTIIRDLMKYHAARFDDPPTKVEQARSIISFMAQTWSSLESPLAQVFADEVKSLPEAPDYYLYHEHLEDSNQPLYFHQFVAKARAAGMEYLGEAWRHTQIDNLPPEIQETLQAISSDLIDLEQFVDFMRSRTFRRTLLCRSEAKFVQTPDPAVMDPMYVSTLVRPQSADPDIASDRPETFVFDNGATATTNAQMLKAALVELYRRWPAAVAFEELLASVIRDLRLVGEIRAAARPLLASFLVRGYVANLVAIHCGPFPFTLKVSQQPRASRIARLLAAERSRVPNLRHRLIEPLPAERVILQLADGTRTTEQIAAIASDACSEDIQREAITAMALTTRSLERLAKSALLEA